MSRRARHRGERLPALFGFDHGTPTDQLDEVPDNPRTRPCSWCHAEPGEPCTRSGRRGRIALAGYHDARAQPATTKETR